MAGDGASDAEREPGALRQRGAALLDHAAERTTLSLAQRVERLRLAALLIAQAAVASALAWAVATEVAGHERPFFAPVAAVITLGMTFGQRTRRAGEIVVGVAVGIGVADLLVTGIGTGVWQLAVVVALAMGIAVLLGTGPMLATQAALSAALVVTLQPPGSGPSVERFVDTLIGGGAALLVSSLVLPTDPLKLARRAATPVLRELSGTLHDLAAAIDAGDRDAAVAALLRARAIDTQQAAFRDALDTARTALPRRGARGHLGVYAMAAGQIDLAVRNVRVLARGALRALDLEDFVPPGVADAVRDLGHAVEALCEHLEHPGDDAPVREPAIRAAVRATAVLEQTANLSVSVMVGQVRSTAADLLRGLGDSPDEARTAVRAAIAAAHAE